jgi:PAS domain-containing protein
VRKDWPLLVSILNKALNEITPAQHTTIRNKWLSIRYEHGIQKSDLIKWLVPIAFVLLLPGIVFLIWNRRLKMEIAKRIGMGQALHESESTFSAIFHHSPVPITISSLETGEYLDVNEEFSAFTGYTREEMIGHTGDQIAIWLKPENRKKLVEAV